MAKNKSGLKIGIVDDQFYSLQEKLMREGHEVIVNIPNQGMMPHENLNVTRYTKGKLRQSPSFTDLVKEDCDLYILGSGLQEAGFELLRTLGKPVLGYSQYSLMLEKNRYFAQEIVKKRLNFPWLKIPKSYIFNSTREAEKFLKRTNKSWALKQNYEGSGAVDTNRTILSPAGFHEQAIHFLKKPNAWFDRDGCGAVKLEEVVRGQEYSFGGFFNGSRFIGSPYSYIEHKGAQNYNRCSVMTGEVGNTMFFHEEMGSEHRVTKLFNQLQRELRGKCAGMVDVNFIVDRKNGDMHLLEFTMRFGRPTLDMQIAKMPPEFNLGEWLFKALQPEEDAEDQNFLDHDSAGHLPYYEGPSVGVVVFPYGMPYLLEGHDYMPDMSFVKQRGMSISHYMPFEYPEVVMPHNEGSCVQVCHVGKGGKPVTVWNERQFMAVGHSQEGLANLARNRAYRHLQDYHLFGHTWRDDIGLDLEYSHPRLEEFKIASKL